MANQFSLPGVMGWELLLVLGIGATVIVLLAAAASRWAVAAAWPAAVWRVATLSLFVLLTFELTGLGQAVVQLCRQRVASDGDSNPRRERGILAHAAGYYEDISPG